MQRGNRDGVGLAWSKNGKVHWVKEERMGPDYVLYLLAKHKGTPRLLHYRFATAGGTSTALCHPFTLDRDASIESAGETTSPVVIHNGVWGDWVKARDELKRRGLMPGGPWSDTRLAVWLAVNDPAWITNDLVDSGGKVAILHKDGHIERLGPWKELREGYCVSNDHWNYMYQAATIYPGRGAYTYEPRTAASKPTKNTYNDPKYWMSMGQPNRVGGFVGGEWYWNADYVDDVDSDNGPLAASAPRGLVNGKTPTMGTPTAVTCEVIPHNKSEAYKARKRGERVAK
jgi:hypothetical protein